MSIVYSLLSECFYQDEILLEGGDENDNIDMEVSDTVECIDACEKTAGCKYWTVAKKAIQGSDRTTVKCQLRQWKGTAVEKGGYVSGSLPSACCESITGSFIRN